MINSTSVRLVNPGEMVFRLSFSPSQIDFELLKIKNKVQVIIFRFFRNRSEASLGSAAPISLISFKGLQISETGKEKRKKCTKKKMSGWKYAPMIRPKGAIGIETDSRSVVRNFFSFSFRHYKMLF